MKDDIDRLEGKIDKIVSEISAINVTTAKQAISLEEHIRRTNILEEKLEPVEKHVIMVNGILKFIGGISVVASLLAAAAKLFKSIGG